MSEDDIEGRVARLERLQPVNDPPALAGAKPYEALGTSSEVEGSVRTVVLAWLSELRRRWLLASFAFLFVVVPVAAYIVLAVPTYKAKGTLQVSSHSGALNPLAELTGEARPHVQTEVEILQRREFVLGVLKDLDLQIVDPAQPSSVTTDLGVTLHGESPTRHGLLRVRSALDFAETTSASHNRLRVRVEGNSADMLSLVVGVENAREYDLAVGDVLEDEALRLSFLEMPVDVGDSFTFDVISDGPLFAAAAKRLSVTPIGDSRRPTNLVEVAYTDADRATAQAVVQRVMERYLAQSLEWQTLSASTTSEFIQQRLTEAEARLLQHEEALRAFAEQERAVQLDVQAKTTIEASADLEAEKTQLELQQRVIGQALGSIRRGSSENVNLTGLFEDPVLTANVAALSEAETKYSLLRATLTEDHPEVETAAARVALQRKEVGRLLRNSRKAVAARHSELENKLESAMATLGDYPDKEIQLARKTRDVEVSQRLYSFLLEKYQEAEILEASTTTDKRVVDTASLPHTMASPARAKLVIGGALGGIAFAFMAVWLARVLQRRLSTVQSITQEVALPVYGTVPAIGAVKAKAKDKGKDKAAAGDRLSPREVWKDAHAIGPEAFRALAVNVSLAPAPEGRARIVQVTSSQPGEGKSTVVANLGVALAKSGAKVLVVDLDLRKPVQHRIWRARRAPGYADLIAGANALEERNSNLQKIEEFGVNVLTAGTRLPDTLRALMNETLRKLLLRWAESYDYVLVDGPPAFVADSTVVGQLVDLLLVVARPGVVERGNLRQTSAAIGRLDVQTGFVMNGVERKHAEYYYYGGSYAYNRAYGSSSDGESDDDSKQAAS